MPPTFNLCQQVFTLSTMACALNDKDATGTADALARRLRDVLSGFLADPKTQGSMGAWSVVWGPAVFVHEPKPGEGPSTYADNAMFVAANADASAYVVAIAGSNSNDRNPDTDNLSYDYYYEDFNVAATTPWTEAFPSLGTYGVPPSATPLKPCISAGTQLGVTNLLTMVDAVTTTQSLLDFLRSLDPTTTERATLVFAGHSLGGALAPTLAAALFNPDGGELSRASWAHVYAYPTAGPTPGNADFATMFSLVFPPTPMSGPSQKPYGQWNQTIWNSDDAIPHTWVVEMMREVPSLYPATWSDPKDLTTVTNAVESLVSLSEKGAAEAGPYTQLANVTLKGTYNRAIPVTDIASFKAQMGYQHEDAYYKLLEIEDVLPPDFLPVVGRATVERLFAGLRRSVKKEPPPAGT